MSGKPEPVRLVAKPPMDRYGLPFMPGPFTGRGSSLPPTMHYQDTCPDCRNGTPHTPVLAVYEADLDAYTEATAPVCLARRRGWTRAARPAELCGAPAVKRFAGIDLCADDYRRLIANAAKAVAEAEVEAETEKARRKSAELHAAAKELREAERDYEQAVKDEEAYWERVEAARSVVYYLRRTSDGMIKIGTSKKYRGRLNTHRGEHGELQILLIRAGSFGEEGVAHSKFRDYQIGRTEWFRPARPVLEWIYRTRQSHVHAGIQPDDALPLNELRALVRAAPRRKDLRWEDGVLLWPPEPLAA